MKQNHELCASCANQIISEANPKAQFLDLCDDCFKKLNMTTEKEILKKLRKDKTTKKLIGENASMKQREASDKAINLILELGIDDRTEDKLLELLDNNKINHKIYFGALLFARVLIRDYGKGK